MKTKLEHRITRIQGNEKFVIRIQLADDCKNGHEDFSLTAVIYENTIGGWREAGGGCCHEEIHKVAPELDQFARLHLSDCNGVPMYAVANGFYWYRGLFADQLGESNGPGTGSSAKSPDECRRILQDHLRASDSELEALLALSPRNQDEFSHALETLGFRAKWKSEAEAAIKELERLTGEKFASRASRITWEPLSTDKVALIAERRNSGYYLPENVAKRDEETRKAKLEAKLSAIRKGYADKRDKLAKKEAVELYLAEFVPGANAIYYDHTNDLCFNWSSCGRLWSKEEFDAFTQTAEMSKLPPDLKFRWQERPKY